MMRRMYAVVGLFVGAGVDLGINLLAAGIQERGFADGFSGVALAWLGVAAVIGLLMGYFLGGPVTVPVGAGTTSASKTVGQAGARGHNKQVTITRLRALFSYAELRGQGITLSDIFLVGSRIKIDTQG